MNLSVLIALALIVLPAPPSRAQTVSDSAAPTTLPFTLSVPEGLCALPDSPAANDLFHRLDSLQQAVGNRLLKIYPTCLDAELLKRNGTPALSYYALVATTKDSLIQPGLVSRNRVINEVKSSLPGLNTQQDIARLMAPTEKALSAQGIESITMVGEQPISVIGEDTNGFYILNRTNVRDVNGGEQKVVGAFGFSSMKETPVFAYFYHTSPQDSSTAELAVQVRGYMAKLDGLNQP